MSQTKTGYSDLEDYVGLFEKRGLLIVIDRSIDKDSELHPLVRCRRRYATAKRATGLYLENGKMSLAQQRNDVAAQSKLLPS
ncbi:MAG: 3-octaprenyl-4-hydroxybenzoate carboxy-lyase [Pseudomonadota bacterium]|jgi:hypothetical protein